jgi:hypothetical protein
VPENTSQNGDSGGPSTGRHGESLLVFWCVRIALSLCTLIAAEPWYETRRRPVPVRSRKRGAWAFSSWSLFS